MKKFFKEIHAYIRQSKRWKLILKSTSSYLHHPPGEIVQFTNSASLRFRNRRLTKQLIEITGIVLLLNLLFILFVPLTTFAESPLPLAETVTHLQQSYENAKDFRADFRQETTVKSIKKTDIEEGVVFFKSPKNMLWNYSKPKAKKLVINSRKVWLYLPQEKVAYTQEAEYIFKSKVLIRFLSGLGKLQDDFTVKYAGPDVLDKNGNYLLILTPLEKNTGLSPFRITVDKTSFLILQISFDDALGNFTLLKFSNILINTGLAEKMFQFTPPAGVSIFNMP